MSKQKFRAKKRPIWPLIWLIQAAATLALGALTALALWLGGTVHAVLLWEIMPICGAFSAFFAVRRGLNNYLAWIAPPLMELLGNMLVWSYPLPAGPVFLCGFISLVGAATGEVCNRNGRE